MNDLSRRLRRGGVLTAAVTAVLLVLSGSANACVSKYDDGSSDATFDFDYSDDVAKKRLDGPPVNTGSYQLEVHAVRPYGCTVNGPDTNALRVNGQEIMRFNVCALWSNFWDCAPRTLEFTAALDSGENTFEITDIDGSWLSGVELCIDSASEHGKSDISANGVDRGGELMWRLSYTAVACVPNLPSIAEIQHTARILT